MACEITGAQELANSPHPGLQNAGKSVGRYSQLAYLQATFFVFNTRQSPITQPAWAQAVVLLLDRVFQLSSWSHFSFAVAVHDCVSPLSFNGASSAMNWHYKGSMATIRWIEALLLAISWIKFRMTGFSLRSQFFSFYYSTATVTSKPLAFSSTCCLAADKSCATISRHISCAVISGTQPSLFLALLGSPSKVSTSVGLK